MSDDLSDTIREAAKDPQSFSADGLSVQSRPMADLIKADEHLAAKTAAGKNHLGLIFRKLVPSD